MINDREEYAERVMRESAFWSGVIFVLFLAVVALAVLQPTAEELLGLIGKVVS